MIEKDGFENTAIKYSISLTAMDGGNLGWVNANSLSDKILNIVNKLKLEMYQSQFSKVKQFYLSS